MMCEEVKGGGGRGDVCVAHGFEFGHSFIKHVYYLAVLKRGKEGNTGHSS